MRAVIIILLILASCQSQEFCKPQTLNAHTILPFVIQGPSMTPTLVDGQTVLVDLDAYSNETIKRGDIIAFQFDQSSRWYVKRAIAVGGDKLRFTTRGIEINGQLLSETYTNYTGAYNPSLLLTRNIELNNNTVPENTLVVLGDGRDNSVDSATFGPISTKYVKGKVIV
jgi:signal peptidase I